MSSKNEHIYFNATKSNLNNTSLPVELSIESESFKPIIDKGDDWEVCVDKFKIPSTTIPKVRVYENELLMGVNYDNTNNNIYNASTSSASNVLFSDVFAQCGGRDGATKDSKRNSYYYDFYSQQDFADALDCTLAKSVFPHMLLTTDNSGAITSNSFPDNGQYQFTTSEMDTINQDSKFGEVTTLKTIESASKNYITIADHWNKSLVMGAGTNGTDPSCSVFGSASNDPDLGTSRPRKLLDLSLKIKNLNATGASAPLSRMQLLLNAKTANPIPSAGNTVEASGNIVATQFLDYDDYNRWNIVPKVLVGSFVFKGYGDNPSTQVKFDTYESLWGEPNNWINSDTHISEWYDLTIGTPSSAINSLTLVEETYTHWTLTGTVTDSSMVVGNTYYVWQNWVTTSSSTTNVISIHNNDLSDYKAELNPVGASFLSFTVGYPYNGVIKDTLGKIIAPYKRFDYGIPGLGPGEYVLTYTLDQAKPTYAFSDYAGIETDPIIGDDFFTISSTDDWTQDKTGYIYDTNNNQNYGVIKSITPGFVANTYVVSITNPFDSYDDTPSDDGWIYSARLSRGEWFNNPFTGAGLYNSPKVKIPLNTVSTTTHGTDLTIMLTVTKDNGVVEKWQFKNWHLDECFDYTMTSAGAVHNGTQARRYDSATNTWGDWVTRSAQWTGNHYYAWVFYQSGSNPEDIFFHGGAGNNLPDRVNSCIATGISPNTSWTDVAVYYYGQNVQDPSLPAYNDIIQLRKAVTTSTNTTRQYVIAKNMFSNLSTFDFDTMFPNGVEFNINSTRSCIDDILKPETNPVFGFVDAQRMRDELLMTLADYNTYSVELAYLDSVPTKGSRIKPTLQLSYLCSNTLGFANSAGVGFDDYGDPSNNSPSIATIPRIRFDDTSQRLKLTMEEAYVNNGISIVTNGLLNNYLAFQSRTLNAALSVPQYVLPNGVSRYMQNIYVICPTVESLYEYESSSFKRSPLYGLAMLCNTIATTGEYTSGGQATTKILTDFDVDESTTDTRDYLLYQPPGDSFRWYDINSAQPINNVNLQVQWVDKYNIPRAMFVGEGMTAKIKLHFRRR